MPQVDPRFLNEDGSIDVESAMAAGRKAHAEAVHEGWSVARKNAVGVLRDVRRMVLSLRARVSSSRAVQKKAA